MAQITVSVPCKSMCEDRAHVSSIEQVRLSFRGGGSSPSSGARPPARALFTDRASAAESPVAETAGGGASTGNFSPLSTHRWLFPAVLYDSTCC